MAWVLTACSRASGALIGQGLSESYGNLPLHNRCPTAIRLKAGSCKCPTYAGSLWQTCTYVAGVLLAQAVDMQIGIG